MSFITTKTREEVFTEFELDSTFYMWNFDDQYEIKEKLIYNDEEKEDTIIKTIEDIQEEIFLHYQENIKEKLTTIIKETNNFWFSFLLFFRDSKTLHKRDRRDRLHKIYNMTKNEKFKLIFQDKIKTRYALPSECNFINIINNDTYVYLLNTNKSVKKKFLEIKRYKVKSKNLSFSFENNEHTDFDIQYTLIDENDKTTTIKAKSNSEGERILAHNNDKTEVFLSESEVEQFSKKLYKKSLQNKTK